MPILSVSREKIFGNRSLNASTPIKRPLKINIQNNLLNNNSGDTVSFKGGLKVIDVLLDTAKSGEYPKFTDSDKNAIKKLIKKTNLDYVIKLLNPKRNLEKASIISILSYINSQDRICVMGSKWSFYGIAI